MGEREGGEIGRITKTGRCGEFFRGVSGPNSWRKGDRTISNAEVSIPLSPGRWVLIGGICCPIPLTPWLAAPRVDVARKKEALASFGGISAFSPSVYRTSAAGWGQGWRGSAGRRSSWGHLPFYICRPVQAWGSGYCQYMPILPSGRKYPQNLPRTIDTSPILWYPIINPLPKGA